MLYDLFVSGIPRPQPRPRITKRGVYTPHTVDSWKTAVKTAFLLHKQPMITVPVRLELIFYMPRPKRLSPKLGYTPHSHKPDLDNLIKSTMDAMTDAGVWTDDAMVYKTSAGKWYAMENTGAQIRVQAETEDEEYQFSVQCKAATSERCLPNYR